MKKEEEIAQEFTISMLNTGTSVSPLLDDIPQSQAPQEDPQIPLGWQVPPTESLGDKYKKNNLMHLFDAKKMGGHCYIRPDFNFLNSVLDKINDYMRNYRSNLKENDNRKTVIKSMTQEIYNYAGWNPDEIEKMHNSVITLNGFMRSLEFTKLNPTVTQRFQRKEIEAICDQFSKTCLALQRHKAAIEPSYVGRLWSVVGYKSCNLEGYLDEVITTSEIEKAASNLKGFICDDSEMRLLNRRALSDTTYKRQTSGFF